LRGGSPHLWQLQQVKIDGFMQIRQHMTHVGWMDSSVKSWHLWPIRQVYQQGLLLWRICCFFHSGGH